MGRVPVEWTGDWSVGNEGLVMGRPYLISSGPGTGCGSRPRSGEPYLSLWGTRWWVNQVDRGLVCGERRLGGWVGRTSSGPGTGVWGTGFVGGSVLPDLDWTGDWIVGNAGLVDGSADLISSGPTKGTLVGGSAVPDLEWTRDWCVGNEAWWVGRPYLISSGPVDRGLECGERTGVGRPYLISDRTGDWMCGEQKAWWVGRPYLISSGPGTGVWGTQAWWVGRPYLISSGPGTGCVGNAGLVHGSAVPDLEWTRDWCVGNEGLVGGSAVPDLEWTRDWSVGNKGRPY